MKKYSLEWQIEKVRKQFDKFKIEKVEKTDSMMLIKAEVECPVYFVFYEHFIVCSGDYGEWQFDTTWKTLVNGKPRISLDFNYLLGKLSHDCNKFIFDSKACYAKLEEWKKQFIQEYKDDYGDEVDKNFLEEFEIAFDDIECDDEISYIATLREFCNFLDCNGFTDTFEEDFWHYGNIYNWQLVCQLVMFEKIVEYFKNKGE